MVDKKQLTVIGAGVVLGGLALYAMTRKPKALNTPENYQSESNTASITAVNFQNSKAEAPQIEVNINYSKAPEIVGISKFRRLRFTVTFTVQNKGSEGQSIEIKNITLNYKNTPIVKLPNTIKGYVPAGAISELNSVTFEPSLTDLENAKVGEFSAWKSYGDQSIEIASKLSIKATLEANLTTMALTLDLQKIALNGLGLVAKAKRVISPKKDYLHLIDSIGSLENTNPIIVNDGDVDRTLHEMSKIVKKYKGDTRNLAKALKANTLNQTLKNIFDFVYKYIQYIPDHKYTEQLRRPLRTLHDQKGDCDCYSILIATILENLGIDYRFRVTAYSDPNRFQHVYIIVPTKNGKYYTVDPVLDNYNEEKNYSNKKDYKA